MQYPVCLFFSFTFLLVTQLIVPCWSGEDKTADTATRLGRGKSELQGLQKKLRSEQAQLKESQVKEKKVVSELNRIEKELVQKEQSLRTYEQQAKKKKSQIDLLAIRLRDLQMRVKEDENTLSLAARALYQLSRTTMARVFFSGSSFSDAVRQHTYLTKVIDYNAGCVDHYTHALKEIERDRQMLKEDSSKLAVLADEVRSTQEEILRHKQGKATLLAKVKSEKEAHASAIRELEKASRQLQALIDRLEKSGSISVPSSTKGFASGKRKFNFPVDGDIITYFGKQEDKDFSTISFNNGIEIRAPQGSPIKAIFPGAVIYANWFKGYGNLLIIDHGAGYYSLSGHASSLAKKVGETVKEGDTIGYVGDTGSLKGANLYFEIRHQGKPLNPLDWLKH